LWKEVFGDPKRSTPACGPLHFILYFYLREKQALREVGVKLTELRKYLEAFQGVRIYRDEVRVLPYGDPLTKEDWLGLNARRVAHPGGIQSEASGAWVLAGNQIVGSIWISRNQNPNLIDQTNREGLAHNQAFLDLRRFALHAIQYLENERLRAVRRSGRVKPTRETVADAIKTIRTEAEANVAELRVTARNLDGSLFGVQQGIAVGESASRDQAIVEAVEVIENAWEEAQT
jgi:hypothetical protein